MARLSKDRRRGLVNRFSKIFLVLHRVGLRTGRAQVLTTTGRKSGEPRRQPVGVVPMDGERYIFQAYPRAAWVANARSDPAATLSHGRRTETVRLEEVPVERRRELLRRQLTAEPDTASLWAGLFDLRENLLGRAVGDLRALAA